MTDATDRDDQVWINSLPNAFYEVAERAQERSRHSQRDARRWRLTNLGLGIPATLLAGSAGVVAAGDAGASGWILVLTVVASGLMAVSTSLNSAHKAEQAKIAADSYESLMRETLQLVAVDLKELAPEQQRLALDQVTSRLDELAELPERRPYRVRLLQPPTDP